MSASLEDRIKELEKEVTDLRDNHSSDSFYALKDWKDLLKAIGIPLALILSCLTFYDEVYLRWKQEDSATVDAAQGKITELQEINQEIFTLNALDKTNQVSALLEAKQGRRERLTTEVYQYYQARPDYFTRFEKEMLAGQLVAYKKTNAALLVAESLRGDAKTIIERADLELFFGRILAAEGPAFNLEMARQKFKESIKIASTLPKITARHEMLAKILFSSVYYELYYDSDCSKIDLQADMLNDLLVVEEPTVDLGVLQAGALTQLEIWKARCNK